MRRHLTCAAVITLLTSLPGLASLTRLLGLPGSAGFVKDAAAQVSAPAPRDRPQLPQVGTGAIRGRVVDGQTGTALARARVRLEGSGSQRPPVLTDATGTFAFTGLPRGPFSIALDKSTYLPGRYPEPGQTLRTGFRPLTLKDGQTIEGVTILMFHGGAITGRVVDAYGDPVEFAQVQALRVPKFGRGKPQAQGSVSTNDLGEFRLARLGTGKYLVLVMPRRDMSGGLGADAAEQQPAPTYYPGVPGIDQAQPIAVVRGTSTTGAEVMLVDGVSAQVTGAVVDGSGQPVTRNGFISVRPIMKDLGGGFFGTGGTGVRPDGTFQLRLPQGEYEIEARGTPGAGAPPGASQGQGAEQYGSMRLSVSGDVTGLTISLGAGARVTGRVVFDGTAPLPPVPTGTNSAMRIGFVSPDGSTCRSGSNHLADDWTFTIDGVFGTCLARFNGGVARWYVKAITYDGKELMDQPVTFRTGQQMRGVELILTDKRSELTLQVADDHGAQTREYVAILFPTDKAHWVENSRYIRTYVPPTDGLMALMRSMSGPPEGRSIPPLTLIPGGVNDAINGGRPAPAAASSPEAPGGSTASKDTIGGMPPGEYYLIALDDIDNEAARDPVTLEELARSATRVSAADGVAAGVSLRRLSLRDLIRDR